MAPPSHRRPGFSRRAQYALFSGYVVAVAGAIAALLLVIAAQFDPRGFRAAQGVATDIGAPFMSVGRSVVRFFGGTDDAVSNYVTAVSTNAELRKELELARTRLIEARVQTAQNRELRALLALQDQNPIRVATARLIGSTTADSRRVAFASAGASNGVQVGQPVRAANGLIGRVLNTGHYASRILLLTDASSVVPIRIARDGSPGFVTGNGDGTLDVRGLNAGASTFHKGDLLITSGTGGLYPPDIPVAIVTDPNGDNATALPVANPAAVDFVMIMTLYRPTAPADPVPLPTGVKIEGRQPALPNASSATTTATPSAGAPAAGAPAAGAVPATTATAATPPAVTPPAR